MQYGGLCRQGCTQRPTPQWQKHPEVDLHNRTANSSLFDCPIFGVHFSPVHSSIGTMAEMLPAARHNCRESVFFFTMRCAYGIGRLNDKRAAFP